MTDGDFQSDLGTDSEDEFDLNDEDITSHWFCCGECGAKYGFGCPRDHDRPRMIHARHARLGAHLRRRRCLVHHSRHQPHFRIRKVHQWFTLPESRCLEAVRKLEEEDPITNEKML